MNHPRSTRVFGCALLLASCGIASGATPIEDVVQSFGACNGDFFLSLKKNASTISTFAPLKEMGSIAVIPVENRSKEGGNQVKFRQPVQAFGITLTGYTDEVMVLSRKEQFFTWGFFSSDKYADVVARLKKVVPDADRFKDVGNAQVRLEMHDGKAWIKMESPGLQSGKVPDGHVERILIVEESSDATFPGTRINCSLQGPVSEIVLRDSRPDFPLAAYMAKQGAKKVDFDAVPVEPAVANVVDSLLQGDLFKPRFKSAMLVFKLVKPGAPSDPKNKVIVEKYRVTDDKLIRKTEIYSPSFFVERLLLGNLVQIKSKLSTDDDVFSALKIEIKAPVRPEAGKTIEIETRAKNGGDGDETIASSVCTFGEAFPANVFHRSLSGVAHRVSCKYPADGSEVRKLYLEQLGMFIDVSSTSKEYGESLQEYVEFSYSQ